jgi:multidrug efflux pump subunit AcrA (membrane-fusion protein)
MNSKSRLKLFFGLLFVLLVCGALALYLNYSESRIGSNGASIKINSIAVGTEYNGIITKEYVSVNDKVTQGEPLFELKSDVLSEQIANGQVDPSSLSYKLDPTNDALIFTAQDSGVITQIAYATGSFVSAGSTITTISDASDATLSANFYLSNPEYNQLSLETPAIIHFPGGKTTTVPIAGITQYSQGGRTVTTVRIALSNLDTNQTVYAASGPLSVDLQLNTNPLYSRLNHNAVAFLHSL